jgi:hypothetical protein
MQSSFTKVVVINSVAISQRREACCANADKTSWYVFISCPKLDISLVNVGKRYVGKEYNRST